MTQFYITEGTKNKLNNLLNQQNVQPHGNATTTAYRQVAHVRVDESHDETTYLGTVLLKYSHTDDWVEVGTCFVRSANTEALSVDSIYLALRYHTIQDSPYNMPLFIVDHTFVVAAEGIAGYISTTDQVLGAGRKYADSFGVGLSTNNTILFNQKLQFETIEAGELSTGHIYKDANILDIWQFNSGTNVGKIQATSATVALYGETVTIGLNAFTDVVDIVTEEITVNGSPAGTYTDGLGNMFLHGICISSAAGDTLDGGTF